jgi:hypothetical protein
MSEFDLNAAVQAAKAEDVLSFKDAIAAAIEDKVSNNLELKKMELAGNIFKSDEPEAEVDLELNAEEEAEEEPDLAQEDDTEIPEEE